MKLRNCAICGQPFVVKSGKARYCSRECRNAAKRDRIHINRSAKEQQEEIAAGMPRHNENLDWLIAEARRQGLSYGQYRAQQYLANCGQDMKVMPGVCNDDRTVENHMRHEKEQR